MTPEQWAKAYSAAGEEKAEILLGMFCNFSKEAQDQAIVALDGMAAEEEATITLNLLGEEEEASEANQLIILLEDE